MVSRSCGRFQGSRCSLGCALVSAGFIASLHNNRYVIARERSTKEDRAYCVRDLVDAHFPQATRIRLVKDNLNTLDPAALYEVFAPAEAERILERLVFLHTQA